MELTNLERQLICKDLVFLKVRNLPKTRMEAINDRVVNVPIEDEDIIKTVTSLPRTEKNLGMVTVGLKRDLKLKNFHKLDMVNPERICKSLKYLKRKHAQYKNIDISCLEEWTKQFDDDSDDSNETNDTVEDLVTDETEEQCQEEEKWMSLSI